MQNNFRFNEKHQTDVFFSFLFFKILVSETKPGQFPDVEVSLQVGLKEWLDSVTELQRLWQRGHVGGPV